jgi:hypothetical protein
MNAAEEALLNNEEFKKLIAGLGLPADATVIADGWVYGMVLSYSEETPLNLIPLRLGHHR